MIEDNYTKWLIFKRQHTPERKTGVWNVLSTRYDSLGEIKWFNRWRCYAFFPDEETIFNSVCLSDIKEFIDRLMKERKNAKT